ncbi:hypothetical protein R3P38DRAFT_3473656 [Favolaschia claudopus]|uniref:Alpha-type protein kinase domain-containing protein n=1 Tax=Favolaschia claudopus TaxID=2862362 RepID=A0AAV9ZC47_9AGAR
MNPSLNTTATELTFAHVALALNPGPTPKPRCDDCNGELGPLLQALGGVSNLENWARWFQKCKMPGCLKFHWHNPPTAIANIPEDVQVRFTLRQSARDVGASLSCPEPNCLTANNQPRRANRECSRVPPRCANCCKAVGGCRAQSHRIAASGSSTQLVPQPGSGSSSANAAAGAVATSAGSDSQEPSRTYARPLSENYARAYLTNHTARLEVAGRIEAEERSKNLSARTTYVTVFENSFMPPSQYHFVNTIPGKFIAADHAALAPVIVDNSPASETWCLRDARISIDTSPGVRLILRSCKITSNDDCLTLDDEIERVLIEMSNLPQKSKTRSLLALSGSTQIPSSSGAQTGSSSSSSIEERTIAPLKFPLTWVDEMVPRLIKLISLVDVGKLSLDKAFQQVFSDCVFKRQTVYKHRKVFEDALELNILEMFAEIGRAPGGKWVDLVKAVEERKPAKPRPVAIEVPDGENDSDLDFDVIKMRKEVFSYQDGIIQSGSVDRYTPVEVLDVLICDKAQQRGHKMSVRLGQYPSSVGVVASVALKKLCLADVGPWGTREVAIWTEGSRLAEAHLVFKFFESKLAVLALEYDVSVLETYLFTLENKMFIAQPWECGARVLASNLDHGLEAYNILSAFSHFTYHNSNQQSVYVDFEGFLTAAGGFRVFDSVTHARDAVGLLPRLGSRGTAGVEDFVKHHVCGHLCVALELCPIPLDFPTFEPSTTS